MEQHPVPQDIKSFKFKLIGDMTIRQFAFLAGGGIIAYVFFISPLTPLLKWPFLLSSAFFGIACALLPVNERPLDSWIVAFFKAILSPTQWVWQKEATSLPFLKTTPVAQKTTPLPTLEEDKQRLEEYLAALPKKGEEVIDEKERQFLTKLDFSSTPKGGPTSALPPETSKAVPPETEIPRPFQAALNPQTAPVLEIKDLPTEAPKTIPLLSGARIRKLGSIRAPSTQAVVPVLPTKSPPPSLQPLPELFEQEGKMEVIVKAELAKQKKIEGYKSEIERLKAERERLLKEAKTRKEETRKAREVAAKLAKKPIVPPTPEESGKTPITQPSQPIKKLVLPKITDQPNIINGVVADQLGKLLSDVIVVVKDEAGTPVRALKTNPLGQFSISTPLSNGVYSIEAEKEGYKFGIIYQEVKGGVLPPLEIRAE
jgi:hypothetical protein